MNLIIALTWTALLQTHCLWTMNGCTKLHNEQLSGEELTDHCHQSHISGFKKNILSAPWCAEQQLIFKQQDKPGKKKKNHRNIVLTINNDLDSPEVNFSPGHDTSLTVVHALICLLDAADLQVAILHDPESH